jgi:hypothetical protein
MSGGLEPTRPDIPVRRVAGELAKLVSALPSLD